MRRALVDRVMSEFWAIFNQKTSTDSFNYDENTPEPMVDGEQESTNGSDTRTSSSSISTSSRSTSRGHSKRQLNENGEEPSDGGGRKRAPTKRRLPLAGQTENRFACPFRKHNPRRYNIHTHRSCALSSWATIARVK
jgi:hypothetical protein